MTTTTPVPGQRTSPRADAALHAAMERLFAGKPLHTDGRLIKDNLWKEAQVSRATINRAPDVLREWDTRLAETGARTPGETRRDTELAKLRGQLGPVLAENTTLKRRLEAAATVITALHAENLALREQLGRHGEIHSLDAQRALRNREAPSPRTGPQPADPDDAS